MKPLMKRPLRSSGPTVDEFRTDLKLVLDTSTRIGCLAITVAATDDVEGWSALAAVSGYIRSGFAPVHVPVMLGEIICFALIMVFLSATSPCRTSQRVRVACFQGTGQLTLPSR